MKKIKKVKVKKEEKPSFPMRINKYLALKNISTRRGADELVQNKKVFIKILSNYAKQSESHFVFLR